MDEFKLFVIGVSTVASILLIGVGGNNILQKKADNKKSLLMVLVGIITALNLILWATMPNVPLE